MRLPLHHKIERDKERPHPHAVVLTCAFGSAESGLEVLSEEWMKECLFLFFFLSLYSFLLSLASSVSALNLLLMSGAAHTHTFMHAHSHSHTLSNTVIGGFKSNRGAASWLGGSGADEWTAILEGLSIGRLQGVLSLCTWANICLRASQTGHDDLLGSNFVNMHAFTCAHSIWKWMDSIILHMCIFSQDPSSMADCNTHRL